MARPLSLLPSLRGTAIAMLAISMLLLQPLASSAWCMATGMGCCSSDDAVEEVSSCCAAADSHLEVAEDEAPAEPCCCGVDDGPFSDLPPAATGSIPAAVLLCSLVSCSTANPCTKPSLRHPAYRARAPGRARPARVLYQVFRL